MSQKCDTHAASLKKTLSPQNNQCECSWMGVPNECQPQVLQICQKEMKVHGDGRAFGDAPYLCFQTRSSPGASFLLMQINVTQVQLLWQLGAGTCVQLKRTWSDPAIVTSMVIDVTGQINSHFQFKAAITLCIFIARTQFIWTFFFVMAHSFFAVCLQT